LKEKSRELKLRWKSFSKRSSGKNSIRPT